MKPIRIQYDDDTWPPYVNVFGYAFINFNRPVREYIGETLFKLGFKNTYGDAFIYATFVPS